MVVLNVLSWPVKTLLPTTLKMLTLFIVAADAFLHSIVIADVAGLDKFLTVNDVTGLITKVSFFYNWFCDGLRQSAVACKRYQKRITQVIFCK